MVEFVFRSLWTKAKERERDQYFPENEPNEQYLKKIYFVIYGSFTNLPSVLSMSLLTNALKPKAKYKHFRKRFARIVGKVSVLFFKHNSVKSIQEQFILAVRIANLVPRASRVSNVETRLLT